ncbi:hypothetical protein ACIOJE_10960 [Kitasatospora sp. NPDC087861]|uniref:hypothetical protein n=1 Tax=Kitasatospora sp. NPDC087861 TaxID=3364070 RepID=UPI00382A5E81
MQRLGDAGQGGVDGGEVLVRPPTADQAHGRRTGGNGEGGAGALAFGLGEAPAVVDRERPHPAGQMGEALLELIADRSGREQRDHALLALACEPTQPADRSVLGGDELVDEPQVSAAAEQGGHAVQGLAHAENHHRPGLRGDAAGGAKACGLGQAASDQGDLVRQPTQAQRPAARGEEPLTGGRDACRRSRTGQQSLRRRAHRPAEPSPPGAQGLRRCRRRPAAADRARLRSPAE